MPVPHCFDYCSFVVSSDSGSVSPSALLFFFKLGLAIWNTFTYHMNFIMDFSSSTKKILVVLIGNALNV
jgi:hypothetical protein